jgi:hypothetical protein
MPRWPRKLLAITVRLPCCSRRVTRRALAGEQPPLNIAREAVGVVGIVHEDRDIHLVRILHALADIDVAEQQVTTFLDPYQSLRRAKLTVEPAGDYLMGSEVEITSSRTGSNCSMRLAA